MIKNNHNSGILYSKVVKMPNITDVLSAYYYWLGRLTNIVIDLVEYHDLDFKELDDNEGGEEIEYRRIRYGHCSIINHYKFGLMPVDSNCWDYDLFGRFRYVTVYNPYKGFLEAKYNQLEIGKDAAVIYADNLEKRVTESIYCQNNLNERLKRYAAQLAHIESTLNIYTINSRQPFILTTRNDSTMKSIKEVIKSIKSGALSAILDKDIVKEAQALRTADITQGYITELLEAKSTLLKDFLSEFGVYTMDDKKERLIVDEVETENKNVKIFLYSYLKSAQDGIEQYNKVFNKHASVELRKDIYDYSELYEYDEDDYKLKEEYTDKGDDNNED